VDGIVYASFYHRIVTPPRSLQGTPVVLLDARTADGSISSVVPDEVGGSRAAVEELLAAGHRHIGFVNNCDDIPARSLRLAGFRQALEVYGVPFDGSLVVERQSNAAGGFSGAIDLLTRATRPTGLFCFNDRMAMGVYQAASTLGLSIPDDVSIVGFDDQELISDSLLPGLTTVALPHHEMGQWAVRDLLKQIDAQSLNAQSFDAQSFDAEPPHPVAHALIACPVIRRSSVAARPSVIKPARQIHDVPHRPGGEARSSNPEDLAS
jgi:LacI family transcriptional regulator